MMTSRPSSCPFGEEGKVLKLRTADRGKIDCFVTYYHKRNLAAECIEPLILFWVDVRKLSSLKPANAQHAMFFNHINFS